MKKFLGILVALMVMVGVSFAGDVQSKYATTTGGTNATLTFGNAEMGWLIQSIYAKVGALSTAAITIEARTGSPEVVTATPTNAQTVIYVDNSGSQFASSDKVMYIYSDGTAPLRTTVSSATTTNVTLAAGITQAGTAKDKLTEVETKSVINIGTTAFNESGAAMFSSGSDSPMYVSCTGTNISITVTGQK